MASIWPEAGAWPRAIELTACEIQAAIRLGKFSEGGYLAKRQGATSSWGVASTQNATPALHLLHPSVISDVPPHPRPASMEMKPYLLEICGRSKR